MSPETQALLRQDPFSLDLMSDPLPYYRALRDHEPVKYIAEYDTFFFARFEDVWDVLRMRGNALLATETNLPTPQKLRTHNSAPPPLASTNPMAPGPSLHSPYYERMRAAHIEPLRPRGVADLAGLITDVARERLDELIPLGTFDLVSDYAGVAGARIICHMFDIPPGNAESILTYVYQISRFDPDKGGVDLGTFFAKLRQFILPPIHARRAAGADGSNGLIDGLINYRMEDDRALGDEEIVDQLVCVMVGGLESTAKVVGQGLMELWARPEQLAAVRADLDHNLEVAAEEIVRYCAPAQYTFRTAHKDVTVAGQEIRAGQRVACLLHSAARDDREYPDAETFQWDRPIRRSVSFGLGQHHCIGRHLALLEVRLLMREFLSRVSRYSCRMDEAERNPSCFQRGWIRLPVSIDESAAG